MKNDENLGVRALEEISSRPNTAEQKAGGWACAWEDSWLGRGFWR